MATKRATRMELELELDRLRAARDKAYAGDDSDYRALTLGRGGNQRWLIARVSIPLDPMDKIPLNRSRKFSNPLFLTPHGQLHAFPQRDEDLFVTMELAQAALYVLAQAGDLQMWNIEAVKLEQLHKSKRYKRWLSVVATLPDGVEYKEPRRTLEQSYALYVEGGREALRKVYDAGYCKHLLAKFRQEGWGVRGVGPVPTQLDREQGPKGVGTSHAARSANTGAAVRASPVPAPGDQGNGDATPPM